MHWRGWRKIGAILLAASATCVAAAQEVSLQNAQRLAWSRHFAEAERVYRQLLQRSPHSRDVRIGLANVLLWEGRYREARAIFLKLESERPGDVQAAEGAATAAYWE